MTGTRSPAAGVERAQLDTGAAARLGREMTAGTVATITPATRTRAHITLADLSGADFRLLRQSDDGWLRSTGRAELLASELVGIPGELEAVADVLPTSDPMPSDASFPPLAPGELLALADVVRGGDAERINAACDDLGLTGVPWWLSALAWGAEASLSFALHVDGRPRFASLFHLLPSGWGIVSNDANDDLTFHPMTALEVQARLSAFAALLLESSHDDNDD